MTEIGKLPRELIEIILAKLDYANDISSCALVCRQWLDIVNNHRSIETSIAYNNYNGPHNKLLRRFKNIRFCGLSAMTLLPVVVEDLCQQAKVVQFDCCEFPHFDALKERILACGNLSRLEILQPEVENSEMLITIGSESLKQKIETLALQSDEFELKLLEMIHMCSASIDVANVELDIDVDDRLDEELRPLVCFLEKHYQDKLRKLNVYCEPFFELLKGLSGLKLNKLTTHLDLDEEGLMFNFISSQPTITDLKFFGVSIDILEYAFRNLPLLTVLELSCSALDDLDEISENVHILRPLSCLELSFDYSHGSPGCDITFIAKLPNLRKFSCSFDETPSFVNLGPIENPMLLMKEFHLKCGSNDRLKYAAEIDAESMRNIFHKMPNLEKITLLEETAKPCQFGQLNALKELNITSAIIDDDEAVKSMTLPNLRCLKLTHTSKIEWKIPEVFKYFPQIAHNCPLLSLIRFNGTVFRRNAVGEFHINGENVISIVSGLIYSYQCYSYRTRTFSIGPYQTKV